MKKLLGVALALLCLTSCGAPAFAQPTHNPGGQPAYAATQDALRVTGSDRRSVPISITTSSLTTTQLVAPVAGQQTNVSHLNAIAAGTGALTLVTGSDVNCVSNQSALSGAYSLTAQNGLAPGDGVGVILPVPVGYALCIITTVQLAGFLTFTQN